MKDTLKDIGICALAVLALVGIWIAASYHHKHTDCGGPDGCSWFWCEHYNGE